MNKNSSKADLLVVNFESCDPFFQPPSRRDFIPVQEGLQRAELLVTDNRFSCTNFNDTRHLFIRWLAEAAATGKTKIISGVAHISGEFLEEQLQPPKPVDDVNSCVPTGSYRSNGALATALHPPK